jgi:hypothetical protein
MSTRRSQRSRDNSALRVDGEINGNEEKTERLPETAVYEAYLASGLLDCYHKCNGGENDLDYSCSRR